MTCDCRTPILYGPPPLSPEQRERQQAEIERAAQAVGDELARILEAENAPTDPAPPPLESLYYADDETIRAQDAAHAAHEAAVDASLAEDADSWKFADPDDEPVPETVRSAEPFEGIETEPTAGGES